MRLIAVRAGDVPAAPAVFKRRGLIDAVRARGQDRQAIGIRKNRPDHMARDLPGLRGPVANQAVVGLPAKARGERWVLIERIEDGAKLRIVGRDFQYVAFLTVANINIVAEV